jgi:hypothetical protein
MRFWVIRMKVDRNIASTEAAIARITRLESKRGRLPDDPATEHGRVEPDEPHTAGEASYGLCHTLFPPQDALFRDAASEEGCDVALHNS